MRFEAHGPGTPAAAWSAYRGALPSLDTGPLHRLVVVAAHPDDETLMAGGLIALAGRRGVPTVVVIATSGEASHPRSPTRTGEALGRLREQEVRDAVARLHPDAEVLPLRLPDGGLEAHAAALLDRLREVVQGGDTVVSTWRDDGHPDHAAVAHASAEAAAGADALHLEAPIWGWHWGDPAERPLSAGVRLDLDDGLAAAKREAIALHVTQVAALSPAPGDEVLLQPGVLEHFLVDSEVFLPASAAQPVDFDAMYAAADDPWGFEDRWYEERKRAVLLAVLPRRRYGRVLEIGCAAGATTAALADRSDEVVGTDVAPRAVEQARARLADRPQARVELLRLPEEWPEEWSGRPFDLIVLSEVGFYLAGDRLVETVDRARAALAPGGVLVACHWRPHVLGLDRGGDAVHEVVRARIGARRTVLHLEDDYVLEVFQADPAPSVAQADGLR